MTELQRRLRCVYPTCVPWLFGALREVLWRKCRASTWRLPKSSKYLLRAGDGIRTRDPVLGKHLRYHCATPAFAAIL